MNIIVADNEDNARLIHQLGENYEIGDIPLKGEKHKMFTFCTSTAYAGCDFYSECASSFVICNSKANNMVVDIGRELKQIAGRQRLESNLFRNVIHFVYNTCALDIKEEEFWKAINQKAEITNEAVSFYNKMPARIREKQKRDTQTLQKMMQYGDDYVMYDVLSDCFVFNKMAYLYEKYAYELQKTYRDGIYVKKELEEYGFDASSNLKHLDGLKEQIYYFIRRDSFEEKMKKYCEERKSLFSLSIIEENDERIKAYYDELGAERIKALGYKESALKNEIRLKKMETDIKIMLNQIFYPGVRMSTKDIKAKLSDIYKKAGIKKTAVAKELENYGFILKAVKMVNGEGKRVNGYEMS